MKTLKERIEGLDLTTAEGIKAARNAIRAYGRDASIKDFNQLLETQPAEDETQNDWLHNLQQLLEDVDSCNNALERPRPTILDWTQIQNIQREWLIPNWLPANTVTMLTGQGGAGKSWLTLQTLCQIACGFDGAFLNPDYEIPKKAEYDDSEASDPKHILFATYEDEPEEINRRLHALASRFKWIADSLATIYQHLHIVDMRKVGSVWGPERDKHISVLGGLLEAGENLRDLCEKNKARLLVMDPLSGAFGGNENDRTAVYDFVADYRGWCDDARCAMLLIGHLPKSAEGKAAGFSGSTAWEASARSMWMLSKQNAGDSKNPEEYWALVHTKSNYAPLQNEKPLIKSQYGWWQEARDPDEAVDTWKNYQARLEKEQEDEEIDTEVGF